MNHLKKINENWKINLLNSQIDELIGLSETGMGYQKVKLTLKNGDILNNMTVINSEFLLLKNDQNLNAQDIKKIEIEKKIS